MAIILAALKNYKLIAGVGCGLLLLALLAVLHLRGLEIDRLNATLAAIEQAAKLQQEQDAEAVKRTQDKVRDLTRRHSNVRRQLANVKDDTSSPAIANAARLLCAQGAAGCATY